MITHIIESYWIPSQKETKSKLQIQRIRQKIFFKFWNKHYTWHTFSSYLIRCANMKWIRQILLNIQSGHNSLHRQADGQGESSIPEYPLSSLLGRGGVYRYYKPLLETIKLYNAIWHHCLLMNHNELINGSITIYVYSTAWFIWHYNHSWASMHGGW